MAMQRYKKRLYLGDWTKANSVVCPAGAYTEVLTLKVPAKNVIQMGQSGIINGVDDRGYAQIKFVADGGANITGSVRLLFKDANKLSPVVVYENRTDAFNTAVGTAGGVRLAETLQNGRPFGAGEDSYLSVEFMPDSASTIDTTEATNVAVLDVIYNQRTNL